MTSRRASTPSRRESRSWSRMRILGVLAVAVAVPGALAALYDLRDRALKPDVEVVRPTDPVPTDPAEAPLEIDAISLVSRYRANEIASNDQFLGRLLRVTGEVRSVQDGRLAAVYLKGHDLYVTHEVTCRLGDDQRALARELEPGAVATVIGTGAGCSSATLCLKTAASSPGENR